MSNDNRFTDDLDAILAEFSSYSESISETPARAKPAPARTQETPRAEVIRDEAMPGADAEAARSTRREVRGQRMAGTEPTAEAGEPPRPRERNAKAAEPESKAGEAARMRGKAAKTGEPESKAEEARPRRQRARADEPTVRRALPRADRAARAEELPALEDAEEARHAVIRQEKPREDERAETQERAGNKPSFGKRVTHGFIALVFMCISVVTLAWVGVNVHPDSDSAAATSAVSTKIKLAGELDTYANNLASGILGDLTYIRKIYTIRENDLTAPAPNPDNFGTVSIEDAAQVMDVIQRARDTGLLDGQEVIFSPDLNFYYDSTIQYYCDETLLVICWKEVIDGNTCSCVEVKIADASQFRRKIADDTYGSPNQYYATTLAKQANAAVAMNADFYMFRDFGTVVYQRELYRYKDANYTGMYSMYNCIDNCFVTEDGDFLFMHKGEKKTEEEMRQYIEDNKVMFSIAFGPILIEDGVLQSCDWYPAGEPNTGYSRAGIGIFDKLHYFYMNLNHSPEKAARWKVDEFALHMYEKGLSQAYGLDGGQTAEIVFQGEPYNYIDWNSERLVSDIIYFATAIPEGEATQ